MASLRRFGQQKPLVVTPQGAVIAGNGTLEAAKRLGWKKVQVIRTALTGADLRAYAVADNRTAELAEWDEQILKDILESLDTGDFPMEVTGFTEVELETMMTACAPEPGEDDAPAAPANPVTRPGDLILLGEHRLLCGDATSEADVARLIGNEQIDMVFTDPPYGINLVPKSGKIGGSILAKNKKYLPIVGDEKDFDPTIILSLAPIVLIWGANYFSHKLPRGQWIVWDKGRPEGTSFSEAELAWVNQNKIQIKIFRHIWNGMIREGEKEDRIHPTQKPLVLFRDLLTGFECLNILDPFGGSGTTMIACEQLRRRCRMMEISPAYCDVIVARWEKLTGKKAQRPV